MSIIELQRRLAEIGRIRLGRQVEGRSGKKHPAALDTFRLTSTDRDRIVEASNLYGGVVTKWDAPGGRAQWEVITKADKLPVVVPPSAMAFSQHYELWSAGGCQRRCDGVTESIGEQPCLCEPDDRLCEIHTRLSVMLRDMHGLGVWRVDTQGFYAAVEIQGAVDVIELAAGRGQMLPATLRLDQREIKRPDEPVKRFVVPVLDIDVTPAELLMGTVAVVAPKQAALTPVPAGAAAPSIADQVASVQDIPSRRRAEPIKSTGIAPRTAAQQRGQQFGTNDGPLPDAAKRYIDTGEGPTQDQPRMVTDGQLTKLGVLLTNRGFKSKTEQGRKARMDFCMAKVRELLPGSPSSKRTIASSTELTFDEAHRLIEWLEAEARKPLIADHVFLVFADEGMEPADFCRATISGDPAVGTGVLCGEPHSRHAAGTRGGQILTITQEGLAQSEPAESDGDEEPDEPGQMDMLAEPPDDPAYDMTEAQQRRIDEGVARGYES